MSDCLTLKQRTSEISTHNPPPDITFCSKYLTATSSLKSLQETLICFSLGNLEFEFIRFIVKTDFNTAGMEGLRLNWSFCPAEPIRWHFPDADKVCLAGIVSIATSLSSSLKVSLTKTEIKSCQQSFVWCRMELTAHSVRGEERGVSHVTFYHLLLVIAILYWRLHNILIVNISLEFH